MEYLKHKGTVSSNGIQTSTVNQVINFERPLNSLLFCAEGNDIDIKIDDEECTHLVKDGYTMEINDMSIEKITIIENNKKYSYDGLYQ